MDAAWHCAACGRALCENCAVAIPAGRGELPACGVCRRIAEPILVRRDLHAPFRSQIPRALRQVFTARGLALAVIVAFASETLSWDGKGGWVMGNFLLIGWALSCCRQAAYGLPPFTRPTWFDLGQALTTSAARLTVSFGVVLAAAAVAVRAGDRSANPLAALAIALCAVWLLPAMFVDAALDAEDHPWLTPWSVPAFARRLGSDLGPLRAAVAVIAAAAAAKSLLAPLDFRQDTDLFAHIVEAGLLRVAMTLGLAALAALTGALAFTRAEEFAHGDPEKYAVVAFPDARPRGQLPPHLPGK